MIFIKLIKIDIGVQKYIEMYLQQNLVDKDVDL